MGFNCLIGGYQPIDKGKDINIPKGGTGRSTMQISNNISYKCNHCGKIYRDIPNIMMSLCKKCYKKWLGIIYEIISEEESILLSGSQSGQPVGIIKATENGE